MSNSQPLSSDAATGRGRRPILTKAAATVVVVLLFLWGLQYAVFPRATYFSDLIVKADRVELRAFIENSTREPLVLTVVTDREDVAALADSIELRGVWQPFDELIGNSYLIRTVRGQVSTDIVIRGGYRLKHGNWFIGVSPSLMDTFVRIVEESGGRMPSLRDLRDPSE